MTGSKGVKKMTQAKSDRTEALLQDLIAECGEIIRTQLRPALEAAHEPSDKWNYAVTVASLVKIGARAGEAVACLRGGASVQTQHRIIVERVAAEGGGGKG
jgi:hypothetical protein